MTMPKDVGIEIAALTRRIAGLERRQRRWNWLAAAAGGVALALILGSLTGPSSAQGNVITAQRIDIIDPAGKQRAVFGYLEGIGPALVFYTDSGQAMMMLAGQDAGPSIYMYDRKLKLRTRLELNEAIGPSLVLADPAGRERSILAVIQETPRLSLFNADGKAFWKTP